MANIIDSNKALRDVYDQPKGISIDKQLDSLDTHCRTFIANSPFLVLGTVGDVSPKGDYPGFVKVIDEETLVIPDRRGNNRLDSLQNIIEDDRLALIFFIPGVNETLRVNGIGEISVDPDLLKTMGLNSQTPKSALIVHVEEAYIHCAKAILRSKLWDPLSQNASENLASGASIIASHAGEDLTKYATYYEETMDEMIKGEGRG